MVKATANFGADVLNLFAGTIETLLSDRSTKGIVSVDITSRIKKYFIPNMRILMSAEFLNS